MFILASVWIYYIDHMFISTCITPLQALSSRLSIRTSLGFPGGTSSKESAYRCSRHERCGFDPWVRKIPWRRKWQPTPVSLPGKCYGQRSLVGCSPRGCKELDRTDDSHFHFITKLFFLWHSSFIQNKIIFVYCFKI